MAISLFTTTPDKTKNPSIEIILMLLLVIIYANNLPVNSSRVVNITINGDSNV